ncbi:Transposase [Shigella dysenteriae 1617]|uniref:Transposase n=1 Tax=Shigella dysenteriae 1617 TaxID=754093 RepID=A0A0A6ZSB8_SHIDY|nr:Transposase [Shigella dysenteriae 1617]
MLMLIVALICELDEQWSFVGSKARQHWLWYAYNTTVMPPIS